MQEETIAVSSRSAEETFHLGEILGNGATGGEVIGLSGPLGAGKTVFVKGLAKGLGVTDPYVSSPTFILVHPHEGRLPLYHIDLYRLENGSDAEGIGLTEYLEGTGVTAIEWIEKGLDFRPPARLLITLAYGEGDRREIRLSASGTRYIGWIDQIKKTLEWKEIPRNG
jgi:tRNA threonylcarbamoyladenosine biosynthesis protein TsaE